MGRVDYFSLLTDHVDFCFGADFVLVTTLSD